MNDPTFLVIGAQKCGTTWLSQMIAQHPEVVVAEQKEVHFFNKSQNYKKGLEWYRAQFPEAPRGAVLGEFTPNYFWTTERRAEIEESGRTRNVPELVGQHFPDLKLIVSLRDPVARAISAYYHHIRAGRVSPRERIVDVMDRYGILSVGYYARHLEKWTRYFSRDQFLILIYEEDIAENKEQTLKKVYRHIGVDASFEPAGLSTRYNSRTSHLEMRVGAYSPTAARIIGRVLPDALKERRVWSIPVHDEEVKEMSRLLSDHNEHLSSMVDRPLPW